MPCVCYKGGASYCGWRRRRHYSVINIIRVHAILRAISIQNFGFIQWNTIFMMGLVS